MPLFATDAPTDPGRARLEADAAAIVARYPVPRSALLPMLHLVQSEEGFVSPEGIAFCARVLDLTTAEVAAVATFYTQYKRHPNGTYTVGVCTNTLCAVMGGDAIWDSLEDHLGVGHDETTPDGAVTLERIECNAACDYAPVVMVNWEFFDNQTPSSSRDLVDRLRAGEAVAPTRGASSVCSFRQMSRVLAGFDDGRADEGVGAGPATVQGTLLARRRNWQAPALPDGDPGAASGGRDGHVGTGTTADALGTSTVGRGGLSSARDGGVAPDSSRGGTVAGKPPGDATVGEADGDSSTAGGGTAPRPSTPEGAEQKVDRAREGDGTTRKDG